VGRNSYKPDKRRRELDKKKKQEEKRQRRQNKGTGSEDSTEDTSYLEYLNPAGMMDEEPEVSEEESEEQKED
jgi:hypothetical protein